MTNREFAGSDEQFNLACELADIKPTRRQASKFRRSTGLAHRAYRFHKMNQGDPTDETYVAQLRFAIR